MLSKRLREVRDEKEITQQEVADYLGITRPAYTAYETGNRQPDFDTLTKLANYFNVTTDWLLGRTNARAYPYIQAPHIEGDTPITEESLNIIEAELKKIREELKRNKEK